MTDEMAELKRRLVVGRKSDGRSRYDEQAKSVEQRKCVPGLFPMRGVVRVTTLSTHAAK